MGNVGTNDLLGNPVTRATNLCAQAHFLYPPLRHCGKGLDLHNGMMNGNELGAIGKSRFDLDFRYQLGNAVHHVRAR